ncbi:MAG: GntR family transcriptional regulator [Flexilinea sp.]|nr:GntR family transcriptional regulator [Flexilinea sp.]
MTEKAHNSGKNYSGIALQYLREQIIDGHMQPGEKIIENSISEQLNISRGPVRDALKQLAVEGLVDYQPNKGCTVALLSPRDAYEVFFLRGSLEKLALEKSGGHIDAYGILAMESALEEIRGLAGADSLLAEVRADEKFHAQIVLSCGISRLYKMWELLSPLNGAMFLTLKNLGKDTGTEKPALPRGTRLFQSHEQILSAIRSGNLEEACRALDNHYLKNGELIYRRSLSDRPD